MYKNQRFLTFLAIDTFLIFTSLSASYFLLFGSSFDISKTDFMYVFLLYLLTTLIVFHFMKINKSMWKYASIGEVTLIFKGLLYSLFVVYFTHFLLYQIFNNLLIPYSFFLVTLVIFMFGFSFSRFSHRILQETKWRVNTSGKRVLIVGAGNAGTLVLREIKNSKDTPLQPIAFVDDDPSKKNLQIMGIPVVGSINDLQMVVKKYKIDLIIIAIPSVPRSDIAKIAAACKAYNIPAKILPRISDVLNGKVTINMIRDVRVEDLLGRSPIELDLKGINEYVTGKIILVTGAGGSIGSEICRQVSKFRPEKLLLLGHGENSIYTIENELKQKFPNVPCIAIIADVQDRERLVQIFSEHRPNIVFHAAAHKHVPLMEHNPTEAIKNNVFGTKNIAEVSHQYQTEQFVLISTDKAVNPTSVMGVTKRIAEIIIQSLDEESHTKFAAVRFGNVLGSRGSVIPLFKQQIEAGESITVTHPDMTRYFMTIPEAVQLVIQAGAFAQGGEIFILDMGLPVKISDLAKELIKLSGLIPEKDIKIEYTGIRPGEKLYEEILTAEEGSVSSKHELIYIAKPINLKQFNLPSSLSTLENLIYNNSSPQKSEEIKQFLKQIIPTYHTPDQN